MCAYDDMNACDHVDISSNGREKLYRRHVYRIQMFIDIYDYDYIMVV